MAPVILGAAVTKETAKWMGSWADGLITVHQTHEQLKEVVNAFRENGGKNKPVYLKVQLSYASTDQQAMEGAYDQWRTNIFAGTVLGDLWKVEHFDALGEHIQPEQMHEMVRISSNIDQHINWIRKDMELGFDKIILHNVNLEQENFIKVFGKDVLPALKKTDEQKFSNI